MKDCYGPSITSFREAIDYARQHDISVEPIIILDHPDETTRMMFADADQWGAKVILTEFGDPGEARNFGVRLATGKYVTFLDADDLWSFNWVAAAYRYSEEAGRPVIGHSRMNIVFGHERAFWLHIDSEDPDFDKDYLQIGNYWDALSFALRDTYIKYPFHKNEQASGYGHEDWHWNCITLAAGLPHKPIPDTFHIKRRRRGSQSARANSNDVIPWPTALVRFDT